MSASLLGPESGPEGGASAFNMMDSMTVMRGASCGIRDHGSTDRLHVLVRRRPMRFRRAFVVTVCVQAIAFVASAVYVLLISRWLGSAGKGLQSVLVSATQLLAMVLGLGFHLSVTFFVAAKPRRAPSAPLNPAKLMVAVIVALSLAAWINRRYDIYPALLSYEALVGIFVVEFIAQSAFSGLLLALDYTWSYNFSSSLPIVVAVLFLYPEHMLTGGLDAADAVRWQAVGTLTGGLFALIILRSDQRTAPGPEAAGVYPDGAGTRRCEGISVSCVYTAHVPRGHSAHCCMLRDLRATGVYSIAVFIVESSLRIPQWAAALLSPRIAADASKPERTIRLFWVSILIVAVELMPLLLMRSLVERLLGEVLGKDFSGTYVVLLAVVPRGIIHSGVAILAGDLRAVDTPGTIR